MVSFSGYVDMWRILNKIQNTKHAASRLGKRGIDCVLYSNLRLLSFVAKNLTVESKGRCVSRTHYPRLNQLADLTSGELDLFCQSQCLLPVIFSSKLVDKNCCLTTEFEARMSDNSAHVQGASTARSHSSLPRAGVPVPVWLFLSSIPDHHLIYWENNGDIRTTMRNINIV